ncbi:ATP-binding protein [Streptomyces sp. NPDC093064]|uniref:ATP-binding protein n=1 Tax=Streptomyces sp. NPDC093064 TaxID=3366020 RepID=UPI00380DBE4B
MSPLTNSTTPTPTTFELRITATPRGARLARRLTSYCLDIWGHPNDSEANETAALFVAELAANAVTHGRVPGRDALLRLTQTDGRLQIEVTDTLDECHPTLWPGHGGRARRGGDRPGPPDRRGARRDLGCDAAHRRPGKTVWAVLPAVPS